MAVVTDALLLLVGGGTPTSRPGRTLLVSRSVGSVNPDAPASMGWMSTWLQETIDSGHALVARLDAEGEARATQA